MVVNQRGETKLIVWFADEETQKRMLEKIRHARMETWLLDDADLRERRD